MIGTQSLIVLLIVVASGVYLIYCAWSVISAKRKGGCGTCQSCNPNDAEEKQLVTLEEKKVTATKFD